MDIQSDATATQPISDDQELAKALAGIAEEPEIPLPVPGEAAATPVVATTTPVPTPLPTPAIIPNPSPIISPIVTPSAAPAGDLEGIKKTALNELRPLIDHVDLPADEKFDTYLMLIRSTDDATLIAPAHAAAQAISDEKRRAQALLDVIKEIDFLSHKDGQAAL